MPNHVTTIITAPENVINYLLNSDNEVDFSNIIKWYGFFPFDTISMQDEEISNLIFQSNRDILTIDNFLEIFDKEFIKHEYKFARLSKEALLHTTNCIKLMLKNRITTGYPHNMAFQRDKWGTKWNAYNTNIIDLNHIQFDTAWSCPFPVLEELSQVFPEAEIYVEYADEDIGHNCGNFTLLNGNYISENDSDSLNNNEDDGATKFACRIKNYDYKDFISDTNDEE